MTLSSTRLTFSLNDLELFNHPGLFSFSISFVCVRSHVKLTVSVQNTCFPVRLHMLLLYIANGHLSLFNVIF